MQAFRTCKSVFKSVADIRARSALPSLLSQNCIPQKRFRHNVSYYYQLKPNNIPVLSHFKPRKAPDVSLDVKTPNQAQINLNVFQRLCDNNYRPFFVNDVEIVKNQYQRWQKQLPTVRPFYAVKCNPDLVLISTLRMQGSGFDCASEAEIKTVLSCGVDPDDIIFANPIKSITDLQYAALHGVNTMTFDNHDELDKIARYHPSAQLVIRILTDDSGSTMRFGSKFGAKSSDVRSLLFKCKQLGLQVIGVSFHVGSGCYQAEKYGAAIALCRAVFDTTMELNLPPLRLLDIGGGFPGHTSHFNNHNPRNPLNGPSFEQFALHIRHALSLYFSDEHTKQIQVIAEPGRYLAMAWSTLYTTIQGKRVDRDEATNVPKSVMYYINDGVYGSFNCTIFDHVSNPIPLCPKTCSVGLTDDNTRDVHFKYKSTIFGPTCDSMDVISKDIMMEEREIGDWLIFPNMGAYTVAAASTFNGIPRPNITYLNMDDEQIMNAS